MKCPRCCGNKFVEERSMTARNNIAVDCPMCAGAGVVTRYVVHQGKYLLQFIANAHGRTFQCVAEANATTFGSINEALQMVERFPTLLPGSYEIKPI